MARKPTQTREESQAQTRERLLDAARRAFARGGYAGASVDVISVEAGYSKGAFYSNFPTKEAIFLDLLARHMEAEADQLKTLVSQASSADEILSRLQSWLEQMNTDADWALLSMELQLHARRSPSFAEKFDELHAVQRKKLGELLATLFASYGRKPQLPVEELAGALIALVHGLSLQSKRQAGQPDPSGPMILVILRSLLTAP